MATFSSEMKVAAHLAVVNVLSQGVGSPTFRIYAGNTLLGSMPLSKPVGSVHLETGKITIVPVQEVEEALATGTATYAKFFDGDEKLHITSMIIRGNIPQLGYVVMDNPAVVEGEPITAPLIELGA